MPDRIETGTYLVAVAAAGGNVTLTHARADTLDAVLDKLSGPGATITRGDRSIGISMNAQPAVNLKPRPTPRSPRICRRSSSRSTPLPAAPSIVHRNDFRKPFHACAEMLRLGAKIDVEAIRPSCMAWNV